MACKCSEPTGATWQPRVGFLWSLEPFALCLLFSRGRQGRLWCKSFAGQPPWPAETVAFSTEKRALLYVEMTIAPKERGRSAFQAPNPTMQAPCRRSDAFRIVLRSLWRYEWPSHGHRLRCSIRPAKIGPCSQPYRHAVACRLQACPKREMNRSWWLGVAFFFSSELVLHEAHGCE